MKSQYFFTNYLRLILCFLLASVLFLSSCSTDTASDKKGGNSSVSEGSDAPEAQSTAESREESFISEEGSVEESVSKEESSVYESLVSEDSAEAVATVYYTAGSGDYFFTEEEIAFDGTPEAIIDILIAKNSLPADVGLNSFVIEGDIARLDMNKSFGDWVCAGTYSEWLYMGAVINSLLASYDLEGIWLTVEGEFLSTGHYGTFDHILGYQSDLAAP